MKRISSPIGIRNDPSNKTTIIELKENPEGTPIPATVSKKTLISLSIVYFSIFLDMMGVSIVQPILPFYAEKFGASSLELGALYSSYSGMATIATFVMGKVSDIVCTHISSFHFGSINYGLVLYSKRL